MPVCIPQPPFALSPLLPPHPSSFLFHLGQGTDFDTLSSVYRLPRFLRLSRRSLEPGRRDAAA